MRPKRKEPNPRLVTSPSPPPPAAAAAPDTAKVPGEEGQWTTGLFSCIKDPINCIATFFCPCVFFGRNAGILERSTISCSRPGLIYALLAPFCLASCYGCAYRSKLRGQFTLFGEPCCDFLAHLFCPCCAICQEHRELKNHGLYDRPSVTSPPAAPVSAKGPGEEGQWATGLFSCIKDPKNCIAALFCPCVYFGRNAEILEKSTTSCVWPGLVYTLLYPCCLASCYGCAYRSKLRGQFTLPGEPCRDFLAHLCCPCCAICQEYRELEHNGLYNQPTDKLKTGRRENWYHTTPPGDSNGVTWLPKPSHPHGLTATSFTYEELATATDNFSDAYLLGKGGFGYVHKGVMANGRVVAVKQLRSGSRQGEREFRTEIEIIGRVHHRNLVSLVGYCTTKTRRLLVYEFVPNCDLQFHLHGKRKLVMDWPTRLRVALGSAKGLAYLHEYCRPMIIHRDIKASNILLDDQFEAKVADFGLAKYFLDTETHVSTQVKGTFGYLAPEYASTGQLTNKSDVYSFGVVLLELITGIPPVTTRTSSALGYDHVSLADRCQPLIRRAVEGGSYDDLVDPKLQKEYDPDQMTRMIACAAACVRHSARLRPQISQIVRALEGNMSLEELNVGTVPGHSQHQEVLEIFEDVTVSDSQQSSRFIN